ncbi:MAG: aminotransferase class III-fold pyridoxal phosphate-dependent enzyme [Rhizobiales bacterium]|nr:aminotransferase class III-fold pyridoxal phosphate-dependent enzyme [Hyphomicrobiales bacterium]
MTIAAQPTNMQMRDMESIVHPYTPLHRLKEFGPLIIESGKGVYVYDTQGNAFIEGMSGLWCSGLGFSDEELVEAGREQLAKLPYYHNFTGKGTEPAIELAEKLKEIAPMPCGKVLFSTSGSEANDTQIKLMWYYNNAMGRPEKKKIISRIKGYHGVTLMAASLTGLPANHNDFDLPLARVLHTDCPHFWLFHEEGEDEAAFVARLAANLEDLIIREGPQTIAAMIAEPIMGAGGVIIPPQTYFPAIGKILTKYDILMINDEVINGFCRTGNWWGCETMGMMPTTISCAKQLTASYAPLSAVMMPDFLYDALVDQSRKLGTFGHGYTYGGHPLSAAIGVKTLEIYHKRNILGRVRDLAPLFAARMAKIGDHPLVGNTRCSGLIGGAELSANRKTRTPFDPKITLGMRCVMALQKHGAILRAIGDTIAICPPMIITPDELNLLFDKLELALDETLDWAVREGHFKQAA